MTWKLDRMQKLTVATAFEDYAAFETIGLQAWEEAVVLDVGCFDGFSTALMFAPYHNLSRIVGIDSSSQAIEKARQKRFDRRFDFLHSGFEEYPEHECFDLIYMSHVLQYLEQKEKAVAKAFRLLKPGGFIIIKTADDGMRVSYPDPDHVMDRTLTFFNEHILPQMPRPHSPDRYFGRKCHTMLVEAGFASKSVVVTPVNTAGKTLEERLDIFERCSFSRLATPEGTLPDVAREYRSILDTWKQLFFCDGYFFSSASLVLIGQKPDVQAETKDCKKHEGARQPSVSSLPYSSGAGRLSGDTRWLSKGDRIRAMCEEDLGAVMRIEIASFPDPWTPLAYALDLRYNEAADYRVLVSPENEIIGYTGVWHTGDIVQILRIAVDEDVRGQGFGSMLLQTVIDCAKATGSAGVSLEVRTSNETARAFYRSWGFSENETMPGYYTNPDEDGVVMVSNFSHA